MDTQEIKHVFGYPPALYGLKGWHPLDNLNRLTRTSVVRNKANPNKTYVVTANYGDRVTAVDSIDITNPDEWEVLT